MPPWFIEKDIGIQHYKDDPSLSDAEKQTFFRSAIRKVVITSIAPIPGG